MSRKFVKETNQGIRGHKLLPQAVRTKFPTWYSTDGRGNQALAQVKFFTPDNGWYWYASEFDGENTFFGLVFGPYVEYGYFSLAELEAVKGPWGLPVERDLYFKATSFRELIEEHKRREGAQAREYMV